MLLRDLSYNFVNEEVICDYRDFKICVKVISIAQFSLLVSPCFKIKTGSRFDYVSLHYKFDDSQPYIKLAHYFLVIRSDM
jgi:hypothetical protein